MTRSLSQWWTGTIAFGLMKARELCGQDLLVEQEKADDRAAVCATCPKNKVPDTPSWLEKWANGEMRKRIAGRTSAFDKALGVCRVCSCELRALVHFDRDIVAAGTDERKLAEYPAKCWKRKELTTMKEAA